MTITIYGIKNCSTMKKAFDWLDRNGIDYAFHDYRKAGIDAGTLERWTAALGWEALVNTRGTTWRKLDPAEQAIAGTADAIALMQRHTSLIRRPVIETGTTTPLVGFDADRYAAAFGIDGETE